MFAETPFSAIPQIQLEPRLSRSEAAFKTPREDGSWFCAGLDCSSCSSTIQPSTRNENRLIEMNRQKREMKTKIKSAIRAACHSFGGAVCVGAVILISSSAQAQNPEILASNVGNPDNIIIDQSSVYWGDSLTGSISSVSKNPGGAVTNYPVAMVAGGDLAQDNVFLFFVGAASVGLYVGEHNVFKTPKFGGFTNPINSGVDPGWALGGTLTIGPAGGVLYYMGGWRLPAADFPSLYSPLVTLSTQGGDDNALIYNNPLGDRPSAFPTAQPQILGRW